MHDTQARSARLLLSLVIASFFAFAAFGDVPVSEPRLARGAGTQGHPASATNGHDFLLTWEDSRSGNSAIYATRVQADGTVLDPEGILVSEGEEQAYRPSVAWAGNSYIVAWESARVQYRRITADGRVGSVRTVYSDFLSWPTVVGAGDTAIVSAYRSGHGMWFMAIDANDVTRSIGEVPAAYRAHVACTDSDCLVSLNYWKTVQGRFIGLRGERFQSPEFLLADNVDTDALAATNDRFLYAWSDSSKRVQGRDINALHASDPFVITRVKQSIVGTGVTASGGDFLVWWTERGAGWRHFVTHAVTLGGDTAIEKAGEIIVISSNGAQHVVAWRDGAYKIDAGIVRDGTSLVRIPVTRTATAQAEPQVVHCGDHLLVVWSEELQGSGKWSVLARRFRESGQPLDAQPIVIADSLYSQRAPAAAFDGHSYLVAWSEDGHGVFAREMGRDGALAPRVLTLAGADVRRERPAVAATDRGFAVLYRTAEIRSDLRLTTIHNGSPSAPIVASASSRSDYAVSWNGSEIVALWSDYDDVVRSARITDGVLLDRDPIVVGFGRREASSLSMVCDPSRCVAAWYEAQAGVKSASMIGSAAFPITEAFVDAADYRDAPTERYYPSVVRRNGAYQVLSSDARGLLYTRSVDHGVASPEITTNIRRTYGSSAIVATSKGLIIVEQRPAFGPGFAGALRLYLRYLPE